MADGADKLAKLSRLKNLKSGLKARTVAPEDDGDTLLLDTLFEDEAESAPQAAVAGAKGAGRAPEPEAAKPEAQKEESDPESLSAYFEALGIVPDSSKIAGTAAKAPTSADPGVDAVAAQAKAEPKPAPAATEGRDVDIRDRWADPVREDDTFLASFAGESDAQGYGDTESLDSLIGSFDEDAADESSAPKPKAAESVRSDPAPVAPEPTEAENTVEAPVDTVPEPVFEHAPEDAPKDAPAEGVEAREEPEEFGTDIDIEAFEKEIALAEEAKAEDASASVDEPAQDDPAPAVEDDSSAPLSITFDEERAKLLTHVSKQMGCSVDDVVVTALDWYLDALFGDENAAQTAEAAE